MKKTTIAVSAIVALLLVGLAAVALADKSSGDPRSGRQACSSFSISENLPVGTLKGKFYNASNHAINGKANGTFTFQVSHTYVRGCVLSITGGTFFIGNTKFTTTGGTVLMDKGGHQGDGWGTTSGGSFLFSVSGLHGNSTKASAGAIQIDFKNSKSEFLVQLGHHDS